MYNNFLSKKSKKAISALLATALVVTAAPINNAEAATAKTVGVKKTTTVTQKSTDKVTGLSAAEKKVVKVTKKGKKFTIKGLKAGKVSFKIGKKSYTVKVGTTSFKKVSNFSLTAGKSKTVSVTANNGAKDTLNLKSSNTKVATVAKTAKANASKKASVKVTAKKVTKKQTATITVTSKYTGKKTTFKVTVNPVKATTTATPAATTNAPVATTPATTAPVSGSAAPATTTPVTATATPATPSATASVAPATTAPVSSSAAPATTTPVTATATPVTSTAAPATTAPVTPSATPSATPEVVTGGTITVSGAAVSGATIVVTNVSGAAVDTTKRLPAGTYTVTVSKEGYETQSKEVKLEDKDAKVVEINLEKMIEVAKVEALNLAEIQITFTKALTTTQATEAAKAANYTVRKDAATSDSKIDNVSVSDDKKSVTLLLAYAGKLEQGKSANKVTVAKAIGMFSDYTTTAVKSDDVKVPQITDVTAVGNKMIKVTFSEAVNLTNDSTGVIAGAKTYFNVFPTTDTTINVTNANYGLMNTASVSADKKTVTINLSAAQPVGTYKLVVYGAGVTLSNAGSTPSVAINDFANYAVQDTTKTVDIKAAANVAQASEVTVSDRKTVKVKFDGPVSTEETPSLTWTQGSTSKSSAGVELSGSDTLTFTFADSIATGSVDFKVSGVKDAYGYTVADKTFTGVKVAEAANVAVTVKVVNDDKIEVVFSSKMQKTSSTNSSVAGDAANIANYTLTNAKGEKVDLSGVTATYSEDGTTYKTTLSRSPWDLTAGTYTLTVAGVKNTYGDAMTTYTDANVVVTDTTKPYVSTAAVSEGSSTKSNKIAITFNEAMATTGNNAVTNAKAYQIAYDGSDYKELPSTATLTTSADGKTVFIEIPYSATTVVTATSKVKVGIVGASGVTTVADASGNIMDGTKTLVGAGTDTTATLILTSDGEPGLNGTAGSVYVKDATSLYVKTDGKFASVDASDFEYTLDGANYTAAKSVSLYTGKVAGQTTDAQYVVVELSDTMSAKTKRSKVNVRVANKTGFKSKTALGTPIADAYKGTKAYSGDDAIAADPEAWTLKAGIKSAEVLGDKIVRVEFTGNVGAINAVKLGKFLEVVNGSTVFTEDTSVSQTTTEFASIVEDGEDAVILTLETPLDTQKTTTVRTKAYSTISGTTNWVTDANGVYYAENVTGVTAEANQTKLKVVNVALTDVCPTTSTPNGTLVATDIAGAVNPADKIDITFNTAVDAASLGVETFNGSPSGANTTGYSTILNGTTTATDTRGFKVYKNIKAKLGTDGVLTIPNVGTISGFEKQSVADELDSLTLKLTAENILTVTFSNTNAITGAGTLKFTPNTGIKNAQKTANVTVETKDAGKLNVGPTVKKALPKTIKQNNGTATLVFSETLSSLGKEKVEALIKGVSPSTGSVSDLTFAWSGTTLTVTNKNTSTDFAFASDLTGMTDITDLLGDIPSASITLADTTSATVTTTASKTNAKTYVITLSEAVDPSTVNKTNITLGTSTALTQGQTISSVSVNPANSAEVIVVLSANADALSSGNTVVFNVTANVKDVAGNAVTAETATYTEA